MVVGLVIALALERLTDTLLQTARRRMIIAAVRHVVGKVALAGGKGLWLVVRIAIAAAVAQLFHQRRRRIAKSQRHLQGAVALDVLASLIEGGIDGVALR